MASKKELERSERRMLASYAVCSSETVGREIPEPVDQTRTEFQRDRDRIIHSKAFRRLSGKTQVFVATYGDHFRDRLTHTLEVAQVARDLARNLRLNEDLCEAIALAHDLGHPPFAHAGQDTLNEIMHEFGDHFEHNEQSKRIVELLEKQFPNFDGLNLTYEVRQGLAKHQTIYDQKGKEISGKTLEAQVVDLADEIAYHNHDLDDGIRSGLFGFRHLAKLELWEESLEDVRKKYGKNLDTVMLRHRVVSHLVSLMIHDMLRETDRRLSKFRIGSLAQVLSHPENLVKFSPHFEQKLRQLRRFLWDHMYQSQKVLKHTHRGQAVLRTLFKKLYKKPSLLPPRFRARIKKRELLHIVVKDYVAGCTDQFAEEMLAD